jgi:large subunit ribosomal protein L22
MKKSYYNLKGNDVLAKAYNCPISMKFSIELAREIRDKPYKKVLKYLDDIIELKRHVPLKRYNQDVAHRKGPAVSGVKSGRFPVKVAKYFKKVLLMAKSNADYKGLDSDKKDLIVKGCVISQGMKRYNFQTKGKRRLRRDQTTSIELVLVQQGKFVKKQQVPEKKKEVTEIKKEEKLVDDAKALQKEKVEEHKKLLARENSKGSN